MENKEFIAMPGPEEEGDVWTYLEAKEGSDYSVGIWAGLIVLCGTLSFFVGIAVGKL